MTAAVSHRRRFLPTVSSWRRITVLVSLLILGWAALVPVGHRLQWWHYLIGAALIAAFLGSWHGRHASTTVRRWIPLTTYNRRQRRRALRTRPRAQSPDTTPPPAPRSTTLEARIILHLRPHPHALSTPENTADQIPWQFITSWLYRYGVRIDEQTITSITRTPPPSGLRTDAAALLTNDTPQDRETWLSYTLRADQNVGVLTAHRTTMGNAPTPPPEPGNGEDSGDSEGSTDAVIPQRIALADTTARRLVAELRERGWLATLLDDSDHAPQFVPLTSTVRRETWTATEYSDGFRALYAVEPGALASVLQALPTVNTKALWVSMTIRSHGNQPTTLQACVGTLTGTQPPRTLLPGLVGFHGQHRDIAPALTAAGLDHALPTTQVVVPDGVQDLRWPTSAPGVPIGFNRARQPVYLGLTSSEPVRITVTGTRQFHTGIVARLALSGLPIALYTSGAGSWAPLANHGAAQQFLFAPENLPAGAIVVTDATAETPPSPITVTLRRPQSSPAPATTIVITQDGRQASLFTITTPHGTQMLSTRLAEPSGYK